MVLVNCQANLLLAGRSHLRNPSTTEVSLTTRMVRLIPFGPTALSVLGGPGKVFFKLFFLWVNACLTKSELHTSLEWIEPAPYCDAGLQWLLRQLCLDLCQEQWVAWVLALFGLASEWLQQWNRPRRWGTCETCVWTVVYGGIRWWIVWVGSRAQSVAANSIQIFSLKEDS